MSILAAEHLEKTFGTGDHGAAGVAAAIVITMLAAWLPARRAARLDLLEAISAE